MKVRLIEHGDGPEDMHEIPINQPEFLIGRGTDCDLRVRSSSVSRHHCIIRVSSDEATVVDVGSSNGTYVNDHLIRSQMELHTGDILRIGTRRYLVDLGDVAIDLSAASGIDSLATTIKVKKSSQ
jgi:pSer/pThr/pTyr-binding forkhead associated (FHA) protein